MKIIRKFKIIASIAMLLITLICLVGKANAATSAVIDTSRKVSLTITKYEHKNGSTENKVLKGVEFTIYEIPKNTNIDTVSQAEEYIQNNIVTSYKKTTPDSGTVKFSDLNIGRYLVKETNAPKNVTTMIESFLVDLPRTNSSGNGWDYDVTVYPKNMTIYGNVTLTHENTSGEPMQDTTWILQKKDKNGDWSNYEGIDILTTNNHGQITIENLEKGEYRFVQNSTIEGYILDKTDTANFVVDVENINQDLIKTSEKLDIQKYVKRLDGEYTKHIGAFTTDTVSWKTEADVASIISKMDVYKLTEKIQEGLNLKENSIVIYDQNGNVLPENSYSLNIESNKIVIQFNPDKLENINKVIIKYDTSFKYNNIDSGEFNTSASLEYTNKIDLDETCKSTFKTEEQKAYTHTGMIKVLKTDAEGTGLEDAKFKIATSEENARNGIFIKDINGNDIIKISDQSGYLIFGGLKYGEDGQNMQEAQTDYWIVEIEAPSDKYNLLEKPQKVTVNSNNEENLVTIINKEKFKLPLTGGKLSLIPIFLGIVFISISVILKVKNKKEKSIEEE